MSSRLPYRNKLDLLRKREHDERQRNLRRSRSASKVTRSSALQAQQANTDAAVSVIAKGYVSDATAGEGLGTPWLAMPTQPVSTSGTAVTCGPNGFERVTTSATFETLFMHVGYRQNPLWRPVFVVRCSDGTTAGELQALDLLTGEPLRRFASVAWLGIIAVGTTVDTLLAPLGGLAAPAIWGASLQLAVQARRTAGAGTITVSVQQSVGG